MHPRNRRWARACLLTLLYSCALAVIAVPPVQASGAASIGGIVTSVGGSPISSVEVSVTTPEGVKVASAVTGTDGAFELDGLALDGYRVRFAHTGFIRQWYGGGETRDSGTILRLVDGQAADASSSMSRGGTISGTVNDLSGGPLGGVAVSLSAYAEIDGAWTKVGAASANRTTGAYSIVANTTAPVHLEARAEVSFNSRTYTFTRWSGDTWSRGTSTSVSVSPDATLTGVDLQVPTKAASIGGKVTNIHGGALLADVVPLVRDGDQLTGVAAWSPSNRNDGFNIVVPAGTPITVRGHAQYWNWEGNAFGSQLLGDTDDPAQARFLTLAPHEGRFGNDIALPGGRSASGHVTDPSGTAVEGVLVEAFAGGRVASRAVTDPGGAYALTGLGGLSLGAVSVRFTGENIVEDTYPGGAGGFPYDRDAWLGATAVTFTDGYRIANRTPPAISGTPKVGEYANVVAGTWSHDPESRSFSWYCNGQNMHLSGWSIHVVESYAHCELSVREVARLRGYQSGDSLSTPVQVAPPSAVPGQMAAPRVVVRNSKAVVSWTAADPNGSPITEYRVDISRGRYRTLPASAHKTTFKALVPGRYAVRVTAHNSIGSGPTSTSSRFRIR